MAAQTASSSTDWMKELEVAEQQIANALLSAGQTLTELSKDKISNKNVETNANHFISIVEDVETRLAKNIQYLTKISTGQPHEGSSYAAQKDFQMACHRVEHVRKSLERMQELQQMHRLREQTHSLQRGLSGNEGMQNMPRGYGHNEQSGMSSQNMQYDAPPR